MRTADWFAARAGDRCGSCLKRQPARAPMRRLASGLLRCAECAKRLLDEDVPAALLEGAAHVAPPVATPPANAQPLQPFVERMRRWLTQLDGKAKAAGSDR